MHTFQLLLLGFALGAAAMEHILRRRERLQALRDLEEKR